MSLSAPQTAEPLSCSVCCATYRSGFERCPRDGAELAKSDDDPVLGKVIDGRYRIERMISEGAMGRVYLAHHTRLSRRFAVKVLFGELAAQGPMRARFAQEAEAASRLEHRNLVSVVDFGESEHGLLYIVMEYIEGRTLERILRAEGPFSEERAIRMTHDLCRGLRHLHARGLIHRDLKLENVVVVHDRDVEVPKIVDFGVALLPAVHEPRLTRAGVIVGTPAFMSPEQAFGDNVDARADLYSLGVVLYHLLTGRGPFDGNAFEIIQKMVSTPVPPFCERNPEVTVSLELEALVMRLLSKHPDDRYGSAQALIEAMQALPGRSAAWGSASNLTPLPDFNRAGEPIPPRRSAGLRSRWPWLAGAAAIAGAAAAAIAIARFEPAPDSEPAAVPSAHLVPAAPPVPAVEPDREPSDPKPKRRARRKKKLRRKRRAAERRPVEADLMPLSGEVDTRTRVAPDAASLGKKYRRVGKMIERLAEKRGSTAAASYRLRHVAIPIPASATTDAERVRIARALAALKRDLDAELRR